MALTQSPPDPSRLVLVETRPSFGLSLTAHERRGLERHFDATITTGVEDTYTVRPGNVVGSVEIAGRAIVVQPKINIDRVLFMTAYAADPHNWDEQWATIGAVDGITDGVAALFVAAHRRAVSQGLLRSYRTVDQDAMTVRGRIQWARQLRRYRPIPLSLRFQIHDDDIVENQILRSTVQVLRRQQLRDKYLRGSVTRMWQQLRDLTPLTSPLAALDQLVWTRRNAHYRPLLNLARTILNGAMPDVSEGAVPVVGFTLHLFEVFEQFVRTAIRQALGASPVEVPDDLNSHPLYLDAAHTVSLKPDLIYKVEGVWRWVGDVKYKRDSGSGQNPDLYQLLAYATATGINKAALIYADGPTTPPIHSVQNTEIKLAVHHLDLDQTPTSVLRAVQHIAASIEGARVA